MSFFFYKLFFCQDSSTISSTRQPSRPDHNKNKIKERQLNRNRRQECYSYIPSIRVIWSQTGHVSLLSIHSSMQQRWKWCSHLVTERGFSLSYSGVEGQAKLYMWNLLVWKLISEWHHRLMHQLRLPCTTGKKKSTKKFNRYQAICIGSIIYAPTHYWTARAYRTCGERIQILLH